MTETRIRWTDEDGSRDFAAMVGYVGAIKVPQFKIYEPDDRVADAGHEAEWLLTSRLPGQDTCRYADSPDELKAEAERWLEEFVSSLGAVFPEESEGQFFVAVDDEEAFRAQFAPGRRVRYANPDAGYPADQANET